mgnify:FL=1
MPIDHPSRRKRASLWAWLYVALVAPAAVPEGGDDDGGANPGGERGDGQREERDR